MLSGDFLYAFSDAPQQSNAITSYRDWRVAKTRWEDSIVNLSKGSDRTTRRKEEPNLAVREGKAIGQNEKPVLFSNALLICPLLETSESSLGNLADRGVLCTFIERGTMSKLGRLRKDTLRDIADQKEKEAKAKRSGGATFQKRGDKRLIVSNYDSVCSECPKPVTIGQFIWFDPNQKAGKKVMHRDCLLD